MPKAHCLVSCRPKAKPSAPGGNTYPISPSFQARRGSRTFTTLIKTCGLRDCCTSAARVSARHRVADRRLRGTSARGARWALYLSTAFRRERTEFNAHRIFNPRRVINLCPFRLCHSHRSMAKEASMKEPIRNNSLTPPTPVTCSSSRNVASPANMPGRCNELAELSLGYLSRTRRLQGGDSSANAPARQ